jgi:hypothetical protein
MDATRQPAQSDGARTRRLIGSSHALVPGKSSA